MDTLNLDMYSLSLLTAKEDILSDRSSMTWAVFFYEKRWNLKLLDSGVGGLNELIKKFRSDSILYGLCRVCDPKTGQPRIILIHWVGDNVLDSRREITSRHLPAVHKFFKEATVVLSARKVEDITMEAVMEALSKMAKPVWTYSRPRVPGSQDVVGTNYRKTNPAADMRFSKRESFWERSEREEAQRKEAEHLRMVEERRAHERHRVERERAEEEERERRIQEKERMVEEQRKEQSRLEAEIRQAEKARWLEQQKEHEEEMNVRFKRSQSIEMAAEAAALVSYRSMHPRDFFRQHERSTSCSSSPPSTPSSPSQATHGFFHRPAPRYQRSLTESILSPPPRSPTFLPSPKKRDSLTSPTTLTSQQCSPAFIFSKAGLPPVTSPRVGSLPPFIPPPINPARSGSFQPGSPSYIQMNTSPRSPCIDLPIKAERITVNPPFQEKPHNNSTISEPVPINTPPQNKYLPVNTPQLDTNDHPKSPVFDSVMANGTFKAELVLVHPIPTIHSPYTSAIPNIKSADLISPMVLPSADNKHTTKEAMSPPVTDTKETTPPPIKNAKEATTEGVLSPVIHTREAKPLPTISTVPLPSLLQYVAPAPYIPFKSEITPVSFAAKPTETPPADRLLVASPCAVEPPPTDIIHEVLQSATIPETTSSGSILKAGLPDTILEYPPSETIPETLQSETISKTSASRMISEALQSNNTPKAPLSGITHEAPPADRLLVVPSSNVLPDNPPSEALYEVLQSSTIPEASPSGIILKAHLTDTILEPPLSCPVLQCPPPEIVPEARIIPEALKSDIIPENLPEIPPSDIILAPFFVTVPDNLVSDTIPEDSKSNTLPEAPPTEDSTSAALPKVPRSVTIPEVLSFDTILEARQSETIPKIPPSFTIPAARHYDTIPEALPFDTISEAPPSDTIPEALTSDTILEALPSDTIPGTLLSEVPPTDSIPKASPSDTIPETPPYNTNTEAPPTDNIEALPSDGLSESLLSEALPHDTILEALPCDSLQEALISYTNLEVTYSDTIPDAPLSDTIPEDLSSDIIHEAPLSDTIPEASPSDTIPEAPLSDTIPEAPLSDTIPEAPPSDTIPEVIQSDTIPEAPPSDILPEDPPSQTVPEAPEPLSKIPFSTKLFEAPPSDNKIKDSSYGFLGAHFSYKPESTNPDDVHEVPPNFNCSARAPPSHDLLEFEALPTVITPVCEAPPTGDLLSLEALPTDITPVCEAPPTGDFLSLEALPTDIAHICEASLPEIASYASPEHSTQPEMLTPTPQSDHHNDVNIKSQMDTTCHPEGGLHFVSLEEGKGLSSEAEQSGGHCTHNSSPAPTCDC